MRIIKDKDGSERILTEDEYLSHKSQEAFTNLAGEVATVAYSNGGLPLVLNVLLFGLSVLIYFIGCITGEFFKSGATLKTMLLLPIWPSVIIVFLIYKFPKIAVVVQFGVVVALIAAKITASL